MKNKLVTILKCILTAVLIAASIYLLDKVLMLKSEDGIEQMRSFYKQEKDSVDALFIGSSHVYCQIDTGLLYDEFGITSFDLGAAEAPSWNSYYFMKEALKTQKPEVIVYEASIAGLREDVLVQPEVWSITNNYGMHWNENRIGQLKTNTYDSTFLSLLIPLNTTHVRYNELKKDDFVDKNNDITYKGFDPRDTIDKLDTPTCVNIKEEAAVNEKHIEYLKKMIELAKENGINFEVMIAPYYVSEQEMKYFNYIERIWKEEGVNYINYNRLYDEIGLDFSTDMAETLHLNLSGDKKWTTYIGDYLSEKYSLKDHRPTMSGEEDPKYASWKEDAVTSRMYYTEFEEKIRAGVIK